MTALTTTTRALRPQAIAAAQNRGALLAEQGYSCEFCEVFETAFTVKKSDGTKYKGWLPGGLSDYPEGKCECQAWNQNGVCKHVYFAAEEKHNEERYARMEQTAAYAAACVGAGIFDLSGAPDQFTEEVTGDTFAAFATVTAVPVSLLTKPSPAAWPPAVWPTCPLHGEHAPMLAFPNIPEVDCERCLKNAY